ncbi:hypothetical protein BCV69DRAFT_295575 [Microstroma glucosiphilum]|uniref:Protein kinase domain-containing protein n=1 Tax=Pseudomicrostroma glucosiphilum TaxID=1684307 RepID=A0A316TYY3_9BASI|nr:hypothetical protein BCV69DRAFT_295575 [Pseudomicrostroma glucosiphilum]PWN17908.1 hypothetical protein BCV69DRAFT_295575 [Pseudomicrostroma glucosiphilum]
MLETGSPLSSILLLLLLLLPTITAQDRLVDTLADTFEGAAKAVSAAVGVVSPTQPVSGTKDEDKEAEADYYNEVDSAKMPPPSSSSRTSSGPTPKDPARRDDGRASSRSRQQQTQQQQAAASTSSRGAAGAGPSTEAARAASNDRERDRERQREAARLAEKENWDKTRGAGSSVMNLLDTPGNLNGQRKWTVEDVLPLLEEVEGKTYEPVEAPSPDVLLSRGIADYTILPKVLGRGKFSTVFMASKNGELSAVKHTALFPHHQLISTRLLREPTLLAELPPHPNLVEVKETIRTPGHFYLVEEFLGGYVTLEALLGKYGRQRGEAIVLPLQIADTILSQLLSAVRAIHFPLQICHRDIKPENILVHEETLQLKLLDFGLATHYSKSEPKLTTCCGSPAFHCPEIVKALASPPGTVCYWGPEVDAWTCGVTMLRCMTGAKYPLGSSHSSLRSMAIRAQRAVAQIPLSDEPGGDETLGRSIRDKIAKLMEMDSVKRIKNFEELAQELNTVAESQRGAKDFKSTSFVPTEPSHKMDLPLLSAEATKRLAAPPSNGSAQGPGSFPFGNSAETTPGTSQRGTPANSRPSSPGPTPSSSESKLNLPPPPPRLILMNPSMQPAQRVLSYIKYCLRCAGILYHSWPDSQTTALDNWSAALGMSRPASNDGAWSPTTPLFPSMADRSDGWSHVQVFQCVIEFKEEEPEEKNEEGQGVGMGLVQSIMAAFGRRPTSAGKRSYSQPAVSPSRGTRTPTRAATPSGTATPASKSSSKNGPPRYLTFYMVVRFPKGGRAYSRPAYSRQSTWGGKRTRTVSSSAPLVNELPTAEEGETTLTFTPTKTASSSNGTNSPGLTQAELAQMQMSRRSPDHHRTSGDERHGSSNVLYNYRSGNSSNVSLPASPAIGGPVGLTVETKVDLPRVGSSTSLSARSATPNRARKNSKPQKPYRNKVYLDLSDERALEVVRKALAVGGTVDDSPKDDVSQSLVVRGRAGVDAAPLFEKSEPGTPNTRDQKTASSSRSRDGRALSYQGPRGGRSSGPVGASTMRAVTNSDELDSPRSRSTEKRVSPTGGSTGSGTPRAGRSAGPPVNRSRTPSAVESLLEKLPDPPKVAQKDAEEQQTRGRGLVRTGGAPLGMPTPSGASEYVASAKQAPSLLSSEAVKEEAVAEDNLPQLIEDLQAALGSLCGPAAAIEGLSSTMSPRVRTTDLNGSRQQVRTLLQDVHHRFTDESASSASPTRLEETISRNLFPLVAALSPATGLVATESLGLPEVGVAVERQSTLRGLAKSCLGVVARVGSPREILMAVQERLEALLREGQRDSMEGTSSSRLDKELEDIPGEALPTLNGSIGTASATAPEWLGALEVAGLITVLTESLPRLKTNKVDMFLSPLARLLPEAARVLVKRVPGAVSQDALQANKTSRPQVAVQVVQALMDFIHVALQWVRAREGAGEDDTPEELVAILLVSFASLASSLPPISESADSHKSLSEQYFLQKNPRYRLDGPSSTSQAPTAHSSPAPTPREATQSPVSHTINHSHDIWITLRKTCDALHVDLLEVAFAKRLPRTASGREANSARGSDGEGQENIRRQEDQASTMDVTSQLGAFLLYVKLQARARLNIGTSTETTQTAEERSPLWSQKEALGLLTDSLGLLAAGLGANPPTTSSSSVSQASGGTEGQLPDCALLYTMWCLECVSPGAAVEEKVLLPLVQLLSTHAALSPLPSSRHIAFTLLRTLLLEHTPDRQTQLDLFRDLIAESPFPQLKSASVAILRELVQSSRERETSEGLLGELQDLVFVVPAPVPMPEGKGAEGAEGSSSETVPASEDLSKAKTYLEEQGPWLIEGLNLLYLVLSRSQSQSQAHKVEEASSVEATSSSTLRLPSVQTDFLEPIRTFLHAWHTSEEVAETATGSASGPAAVLGGQSTASPAQTGLEVRSESGPGSASGSELVASPAPPPSGAAGAAAVAASTGLPRVSTSSSSSMGHSASHSYSHSQSHSHSHSHAGSQSGRSIRATLDMHMELLQVALSRVEEVWPAPAPMVVTSANEAVES